MNDCVEQVTGGGFPWIILVVVAIVAGVFVYRNGIVGTEASLKALAEKLKARLAKIEAKAAAKRAAVPAAAPVTATPIKTKAQRISENNSLVLQGVITREAADLANAAILKEA